MLFQSCCYILPRQLKRVRESKQNANNKRSITLTLPVKLFPRSPSSTLEPSITVMLPTPPRTRFFNVSDPVGPQLSKHILAFSRAACPWSPQILQFQFHIKFQNRTLKGKQQQPSLSPKIFYVKLWIFNRLVRVGYMFFFFLSFYFIQVIHFVTSLIDKSYLTTSINIIFNLSLLFFIR